MTERRYSDEEVAEIFERASDAQSTRGRALPPSPDGDGLTLPELEDIGREVGIPAHLIQQAARSLYVADHTRGRQLLGMPIGVSHSIDLERPLTEEEWHRLVVDLRETFDARGRLRDDGAFKQWTNGNLEALLEPTRTGQRLRLRTLKGNAIRSMGVGAIMLGFAGVLTVTSLLHGDLAGALPGVLIPLAIGLGMVGGNVLRLPAWARLRRRQMQEVAERLTLGTTSDPGDAPSGVSDS